MIQSQIESIETYTPIIGEAVKGKTFRFAQGIDLKTPSGRLTIYTSVSADEIGRFDLDAQFELHSGLGSPEMKRETLMKRADQDEPFVALAVSREKRIAGFCTVANPAPDSRWAELNSQAIMNVEIIEVARAWRGAGVGRELLKTVFDHPRVEEKIVYMEGYTWTWDLEGNKMSAARYREMMKRLFESFQFAERKTNEPNISLDVNNLFMCRVGKNVDKRLGEDFKWLSVGVRPN